MAGVDVASERGVEDRARHQRIGGDAVIGPASRRLDGEQHIGGLRLPVRTERVVVAEGEVDVVEDDRRSQVSTGADRDDPRSTGGCEYLVQSDGEREVTEMVCGEMYLVSAGRQRQL